MRNLKHALFYIISSLLLISACNEEKSSAPENSSGETSCLTSGYYVSSNSGDDSNSGTSPCSPWKSLSKVSGFSFSGSTTIYLKRGETWNEKLVIPTDNLSISAYGSGSLPIISGSVAAGPWNNEGGGIYSYAASIDASEGLGNISKDGTMMSFVEWDTDHSTTLGGASDDSYTYDDSTDTVYIKVVTDPASNTFEISSIFTGIEAENKSNVSVSNLNITRFSLHGINFKNCVNCDVTNVTISQTGGADLGPFYAGNGIEYGNTSSSGTVDSVTVSEIFDSCLSPQTFDNSQTLTNITFKNSTLTKCGFAGVEISILSNGGTTGSTMSGISVENIIISDTGKGWSGRRYGTEGHGIRIQADSGAGTISDTLVTRTQISNAAGDGIKVLGDTGISTVSRSKINGNDGIGVNFSEATSSTPKLNLYSSLIHNNSNYGVSFNCPSCQGFDIYHNTFYDNTTINLAIFAQSNSANLKNNVFYSSSAMTHFFVNSTLASADVDTNCYNDSTNLFGYNSATYSTVSAFNASTSFEAGGIGNGIVGLTNPATEDFTLTSASDCKSLGSTGTGVTLDYSGSTFSSPPSSGAYQF
ncbi:MAG: hypothetical protein GY909_07410 [Oligoflexia bacterium]|nr:hypothetical protein [Oligoflexia bacterium]